MSDPDATRIVVLDDDPLGGQCVRDVPVLTTWAVEDVTAELRRSAAFLLLTNTRALSRPAAMERAREVGDALRAAANAAGVAVTPVWRSDSTLRGHFWWEMSAFDAAFSSDQASQPVFVFIPYFGEAGRVTMNDAQLVEQDGQFVPVDQTEFARDPHFSFSHSRLPYWLEEHTDGHFKPSDMRSISHGTLRSAGPDVTAEKLRSVPPGGAVVINSVADLHVEIFVLALQQAEAAGQRFLCTGAAPFIRARLGQKKSPLLTAADLGLDGAAGGLTIVGSYVDKTTSQLREALKDPDVIAVELPAGLRSHDVTRVYGEVSDGFEAGRDVILYTAREHAPDAGSAIANGLATIVSDLAVRPRYLLVKGGSTASHLATEALSVRRAIVLGQLQAGVPVWRLGEESRWPGLPFVIFAGNVGGVESLAQALRTLRA